MNPSPAGNIFRLKIPPAVGLLAIGAVVCGCGVLIFAKLNGDAGKPAEPPPVAVGASGNVATSNQRSTDPLGAFVDQLTAVCSKANDGTKFAGYSLGSRLSEIRETPFWSGPDASVEIRLREPETVLLYSRGRLKCVTRVYRANLLSYLAELENQFGPPCRRTQESRPGLNGGVFTESFSEYVFSHACAFATKTPYSLTVTVIDRDYFADLVTRDLHNINTGLQGVRNHLNDFENPQRWSNLRLPNDVTFCGRSGEHSFGERPNGMVWSSQLMAYALCGPSNFPESFENTASNYPSYLAELFYRIEAAWIQRYLPPVGDVREVYEALPGRDRAPKLSWMVDDYWHVVRTPDRRVHVYRPLTKNVTL